jgi:hypothetical protein
VTLHRAPGNSHLAIILLGWARRLRAIPSTISHPHWRYNPSTLLFLFLCHTSSPGSYGRKDLSQVFLPGCRPLLNHNRSLLQAATLLVLRYLPSNLRPRGSTNGDRITDCCSQTSCRDYSLHISRTCIFASLMVACVLSILRHRVLEHLKSLH